MGLILDSSVVLDAERRGETVERLIERVVAVAGDQEAAIQIHQAAGAPPRWTHARAPRGMLAATD